ncbi:uncharacterized protein DUF742 [Prauserella shujinwangii]|uniref:Uncharacterized protein DUF742 n=1 Tax=Prauserella shujinwangii TaxID=1453103 RepID=A0A2T0LUP0_9PSEU|nr:DUF742 domain-containing protein [Prauserella shujinwangii]PRX47544.1 uncharacterized protein DUF742 [Prauserella shujinwangii]
MGKSDRPEQAGSPATGRSGARFPSARQRQRFENAEPEPAPAEHPPRGAERSRVGRSGARFPSVKLLEQFEQVESAEPPPTRVPATPPPPRRPPPAPSAPPRQRTTLTFAEGEGLAEAGDAGDEHRLRVRPYVLTKGRTHAAHHLAVETLVSVDPRGPWRRGPLSGEYQAVRRLCVQPRSVAEVAATLAVPLGVARVLLSDMADAGLIVVHGNRATAEGRPDLPLLERVLRGLRAV